MALPKGPGILLEDRGWLAGAYASAVLVDLKDDGIALPQPQRLPHFARYGYLPFAGKLCFTLHTLLLTAVPYSKDNTAERHAVPDSPGILVPRFRRLRGNMTVHLELTPVDRQG
jgi:hypothetical protein